MNWPSNYKQYINPNDWDKLIAKYREETFGEVLKVNDPKGHYTNALGHPIRAVIGQSSGLCVCEWGYVYDEPL